MEELTIEKIERLRNIPWSFGNNILYDMCSKNPKHTESDVILAKIWLIGRAYSASIERGAGTNINEAKRNKKDFFLDTITDKIKSSNIDSWLGKLENIEKINIDNYETILEVHHNLTNLFKDISGLNKRSLASKYLHFHYPKLFFIYDSIAKKELTKIVKKKLDYPKKYDREYAAFVRKCIFFRDKEEEKLRTKLLPKDIDLWLFSQQSNWIN